MGKIRTGLLVALVLIPALAAAVGDADASRFHRSGVTPAAGARPGPTTMGEPDSGQNGKDNKEKVRPQGIGADTARQTARWLRWTSGIWMARYRGVLP